MKQYIDIHTHKEVPGSIAIVNRHAQFEQAKNGTHCSLGIHPWYVYENSFDSLYDDLCKYATLPNVLAIGECGLDKVAGTDWQLQEDVFAKQIALANRLQKPLIIHCVRAYTEVLQMLEMYRVSVPVIFHGFNKSTQLAKQITGSGYYISLGDALLKEDSNAIDVIKDIAFDKIFLETDDADVAIQDIYTAASAILKCEEDSLILQLRENFQTVFGI